MRNVFYVTKLVGRTSFKSRLIIIIGGTAINVVVENI